MRIPRVALLCFVIGSGAFVGCGGSNSPKSVGTGGNAGNGASGGDQPVAAMCDGGGDCSSGPGDGEGSDMGADDGNGGGKGMDGGMHKADGGHPHPDGGDDGNGNDNG